MATYPPLPGGFIYDLGRDGSQNTMKNYSSGEIISTLSAAQMDRFANWQNVDKLSTAYDNSSIIVQFPQPRTVTGIHASVRLQNQDAPVLIQTSTDTTDGIDGAWTTAGQFTATPSSETDAVFRKDRLFTVGLSNITAVRVIVQETSWEIYFRSLMVWGTTVLEGLVPWHATLDQALDNDNDAWDRGDILITAPPVTQQFRLKNTSPTSTATDVVVAADATGSLGSLADEVEFSLDDTTFTQAVTIPSIATDQVSPLIYMKRPTPTDLAGTIRSCNIRATVTAWT